jgi:four helix bundle suffix protein
LEELRLDYEDFLRQRSLLQWERTDTRGAELVARRAVSADEVALWARDIFKKEEAGPTGREGLAGQGKDETLSNSSTESNRSSPLPHPNTYPEIAANGALVLINVACTLLDRQIASLAKMFEKEGGFTERLYKVRSAKTPRMRSQPNIGSSVKANQHCWLKVAVARLVIFIATRKLLSIQANIQLGENGEN